MTLIGELTPTKNPLNCRRALKGDNKGSQAFAWWLGMYADNRKRAKYVIDIFYEIQNGNIEEKDKLTKIESSISNFSGEIEVIKNFVFIYDYDYFGDFIENIVAITIEQIIFALNEYISCLNIGLKNTDGFLIEYELEGKEAKALAKDLYKKYSNEN